MPLMGGGRPGGRPLLAWPAEVAESDDSAELSTEALAFFDIAISCCKSRFWFDNELIVLDCMSVSYSPSHESIPVSVEVAMQDRNGNSS
jgi:hypothetical protein